ncbi:hypothetical protein CC80DRAFT_495975 [Byssothecium circinans]|uniref:Endonuclease/exonuclease/phosphatase domain-containing protein n=1 Tax=Byssothecium circinans TaxID=147558 RepID=A0A6A5TFI4_9PLEO|nr:hypothetical protein CC80DRAFT_495975 [Byssothecium circinans]
MSTSNSTPTHVLEALQTALAHTAQKQGDDFYKPRPQQYWYHDDSKWKSIEKTPPPPQSTANINPKALRLISWNIDMLIGFASPRMSAALTYLSTLVSSTPPSTPVIIFLQEMTQADLVQIRDAKWVQERFYITDYDSRDWMGSLYGTTTLVDKMLKIETVFRVPWISKFGRDGLFVDIALSPSAENLTAEKEVEQSVLRLCNTHLESLVADPPIRPLQLSAAAPYLHDPKTSASLLAGDLNAIQPFDRTLHSENNLKDAYLELGGQEDSGDGYTWGYQVPQAVRERFGCSRMDKILFTGDVGVKGFERIGMGVKVVDEGVVKEMREKGEDEWVTDHYGVMGDFELGGGRKEEIDVRSKLA